MKLKKTAAWIVLSLVPAMAWFFTLRPTSLGGPSGYVMVRGVSMLPTYVAADQPRDDDALHLTRPLTDLEDLRVAVEPRDGELFDVAIPAVHLNRFSRHVDGHLGGEELRHGGLHLERFSVLAESSGVV